MKKVLLLSGSIGAFLCLGVMNATAQQLPNNGFETWKETCGTIWQTASSNTFVRPGVEPEGWNGSNVQQVIQFPNFVTRGTGREGASVVLTNQEPGFLELKAPAPAFISMATPWIFADLSKLSPAAIAMGDGGVYGGVEFSYRPDAITGYYKRNNSAGEENAHIIAYLWNGTYTSQVRSAISGSGSDFVESATVELEDVDRAIMGIVEPTQSGKLIASCDYEISGSLDEWTRITVPLEYVEENLAETPAKMNVIISSADYWNRAAIVPGNVLEADDVRFLYYSQLQSLSINGSPLEGFDKDTYNYVVSGACPTDPSQVQALPDGKNASVKVECNEAAQLLTIVVENVGEDAEGAKSHTYTVQYEPVVPVYYNGLLTIDLSLMGMGISHSYNMIEIASTDDNLCDFSLRNFSFMGIPIGDITVPDVQVSDNAGVKTYTGRADNMFLAGMLDCDVVVTGSEDADGNMDMTISVLWYTDRNASQYIPITVFFEGSQVADGLRLTDIKVNGESLGSFNKDTFNYAGDGGDFGTSATPLITYTKEDAGATVSVAVNDFAVRLIVEKDGASNFYSILDGDASFAGIELAAAVEGDLVIAGQKEVRGVESVAGSVVYEYTPDDKQWFDIALPFATAQRQVITAEGATADFDGLVTWSVIKADGSQFSTVDANTATVGIAGIADNGNVAQLRFTSEAGWQAAGTAVPADNTPAFAMIGNPTLAAVSATDLTDATTYYVLNSDGTKFIQSASPVLRPFSAAIVYNGNAADAPAEIDINVTSGIQAATGDAALIYAANRHIVVKGYEGDVYVYTLDGKLLQHATVAGECLIPVATGTYIVRTAGEGTLVMVR